MNYYYDIILDFQENNYCFYEAEETDCFDYIKKIPLFQVKHEVLKDFVNNQITVDSLFLKTIYNRTINKNNSKLEYVCLLTDKHNCFAFEFNKEGNIISRSILTLEDELNILEIVYTVKEISIKYNIVNSLIIDKTLRKEEYIRRFINTEVCKLEHDNNKSKLQYLYMEWFDKLEYDFNKMVKDMKNKLNKDIGLKEEKILNIIKNSYNKV